MISLFTGRGILDTDKCQRNLLKLEKMAICNKREKVTGKNPDDTFISNL